MLDILHFVQEKHDFIQTSLLLGLLGVAATSFLFIKFIFSRVLVHITGWKSKVDALLENSPLYQQSTTEHLTSILACQQSQSVTLDEISSLLSDQRAHNAKVEGEIKILHMKHDTTAGLVVDVKKNTELNTRVIGDIHNRTTALENAIKVAWSG